MLKDFYIKFLERESALCKAQLVHVGQQAASIKDKAQAQGWGRGPLELQDASWPYSRQVICRSDSSP
jgi:hypothetical protein